MMFKHLTYSERHAPEWVTTFMPTSEPMMV